MSQKSLSKGKSTQDGAKSVNTPSKNSPRLNKGGTRVSESTEQIIRNTTTRYRKAIQELANR